MDPLSGSAFPATSVSVGGYWLIDWVFVTSAPQTLRKVPRHLFEGKMTRVEWFLPVLHCALLELEKVF